MKPIHNTWTMFLLALSFHRLCTMHPVIYSVFWSSCQDIWGKMSFPFFAFGECLAEGKALHINPSWCGRCRMVSGSPVTSFSLHSSKGLEFPCEWEGEVGRLRQSCGQIKLTGWSQPGASCVSFLCHQWTLMSMNLFKCMPGSVQNWKRTTCLSLTPDQPILYHVKLCYPKDLMQICSWSRTFSKATRRRESNFKQKGGERPSSKQGLPLSTMLTGAPHRGPIVYKGPVDPPHTWKQQMPEFHPRKRRTNISEPHSYKNKGYSCKG